MPNREPDRIAYVPPRAVRARKLILRTQLGLPWMLAALAFAGVILLAGLVLVARGGRPAAPWVRIAPASALPAGSVTERPVPGGQVVVVDRRGDALRTFLAPAGPCPVVAAGDGFARPCQRLAWRADGAAITPGVAGLRRVPAQVARGDLYVDPETG